MNFRAVDIIFKLMLLNSKRSLNFRALLMLSAKLLSCFVLSLMCDTIFNDFSRNCITEPLLMASKALFKTSLQGSASIWTNESYSSLAAILNIGVPSEVINIGVVIISVITLLNLTFLSAFSLLLVAML